MNTKKSLIIGGVVLAIVLLIAVGFAALTNVTLNINGSATATPNDKNFTVKFTGTPTTSVSTDSIQANATVSSEDAKKATLNVSGLTAKGETASATYTIKNESADLTANLSATSQVKSNSDYFKVTAEIANSTLAAQGTTTIKVTVELLKTPVADEVTAEIETVVTAEPSQPNA